MRGHDAAAQVDRDLRKMLVRPDAPPPRKIGVRVWPKAIPQFNLGHLEVVQVGGRLHGFFHTLHLACPAPACKLCG